MNCPFCNAKQTWEFHHDQGDDYNFACETAIRDSEVIIPGIPCLESRLAALTQENAKLRDFALARYKGIKIILSVFNVKMPKEVIEQARELGMVGDE